MEVQIIKRIYYEQNQDLKNYSPLSDKYKLEKFSIDS